MKQTRTGSTAGRGDGWRTARSEQCGHPCPPSSGDVQRVWNRGCRATRQYAAAWASNVNSSCIRSRPAAPMHVRESGIAEQFRHLRPAIASGRRAGRGTRSRRRRSTSGVPPTAVATTGTPAALGFERDVRQPLGERRQHDDVGRADERIEVGAEPRQHDPAGEAEFRDAAFEFAPQRAFAEEHDARGRVVAADGRGGFDQHVEPLLGAEPPAARTTCDTAVIREERRAAGCERPDRGSRTRRAGRCCGSP